jgi:hypothetical protein
MLSIVLNLYMHVDYRWNVVLPAQLGGASVDTARVVKRMRVHGYFNDVTSVCVWG